MDMHGDTLFKHIVNSIDESKFRGGTESLRDELSSGKSNLNTKDSQIVTDLIDIIDKIKEDRGMVVELIKITIMIVERIPGKNQGSLKKQDALEIFSSIINCIGVSQRDRKFYMAVFDNTVELAFWGRDWFKSGGWDNIKKIITCCK